MKTLILKAVTLLSMVALVQGCYPGGAEYTSDLDIAISQYESAEKLRSYKTYYLSQTMDIRGSKNADTLTSAQQDDIIANTDALLKSTLGLSEITNPTADGDADIVVQLTQIAIQQTGVAWSPGYPGYPGWGYPGWGYPGYGYPGYPGGGYYPWGGYSYYQYSNGSVIVDFIDVAETKKLNEGTVQGDTVVLYLGWVGGLNGVLSRSNNVSIVNDGIETLFNQYNTAKAGTDN
ncbi:DUF4136 domain-containing protein [Flammeovirga pectinis]|uniref:DUF4136 domain-containing protein n=1 Tax=Flammeovirga pectinis TaxID=2494373 RepID=A0A3Q9FND3_9BACT|nr:DUF4136 domain-containing protein [Flammeovirga pectinis]AZQ64142.1 DUF4136 domain-containing protein [Flammeovirga pectinis]